MKLSTLVGASGLSATATPAKGASLFGRIANLHSVISKGNHVGRCRRICPSGGSYLSGYLNSSQTDTISHRWQVDIPTHFRTFNRIRKLLPGAQGNYKIDPGRRSVSTTYGILVKKLKKEREAAAEADAAATG